MAEAFPVLIGYQIHLRQLDAGVFKGYKLPNHPVGACQIIITIDKNDNKSQEHKRLWPLFSFPQSLV
jgi:hypothetical protein